MRAVSRVTIILLAAASVTPALAVAQQTTPTNNSTSSDAVGPPQLQDFRLPGTVTRPADRPATSTPSTASPPAPAQTPPVASSPAPRMSEPRRQAPAPAQRQPTVAERPSTQAAPPVSPRTAPSTAPEATSSLPGPTVAPAPPPSSFQAAAPVAPGPQSPAIPAFAWLLAAVLLGAGAAFLFFRSRGRRALAGGLDEELDQPVVERTPAPSPPAALPPVRGEPRQTGAVAAPPVPTPVSVPAPAAPVTPQPAGIVSTRLRPWLEVGFNPVRCMLDEQQVTIDFEVQLLNSGSAPARDILIGAMAFNASPSQDAVISSYFDHVGGESHGIDMIPPLERVAVPLQLVMPRDQLQAYDLGGQQVSVPLLGISARYRWMSSEGQSAASYLLGRETSGEKLAPFPLTKPQIFRRLGTRPLPTFIRR